VIVKGTSCAGARRLTVHLMRTDTNERAVVKDIRGVFAQDLLGALREMEAVAAGARTTKPFYHGSINTREDERLTDEQRTYAIDKLEAALGLTGQPRVVVVHEKEGREHCHIVWSRIDLDRMAAISDSNNYRKHEEVARALEKEFGHERVQGAHVERDGKDRPKRTPSHSEMLQAERTGVSPQQAKELITGIWNTTKNGKEFQAALAEKGWILARGDRRDFVAIDPTGGTHSISRRIEGAKAADVRQRFADIDPRDLPSVAEAKQDQRERAQQLKVSGRDRQGMVLPRQPVISKAANQNSMAVDMPRERLRPMRGAGAAASKIADSMFSALMGEKPTPKEKESDRSAQTKNAGMPSEHRQQLMRQLSREVPTETERDAEYEVDKGRERSRG
jgi:Relaxase/Mobilisation nuclease domain